jgi:hypothetical protein
VKPNQQTPVDFYDYLLRKGYSEREVIDWRGIPPGLYYNLPPLEKLPRFGIEHGNGVEDVLYAPTKVQRQFHSSTKHNCILEGPRGTGKSKAIRFDAHMRAHAIPNWSYLILRRQTTDLKKSHLIFMDAEMKKLGGTFNKTDNIAKYPNGSLGFFTHCEHLSDIMHLLSSQFGGIYFDEITTFLWEMVTKIGSCARVEEDSGLIAFVKGGTNPLGVGAQEVKKYYITKTVTPQEDEDYDPNDYEAIHTVPMDNPYIDWKQYRKRLGSLDHKTKRAWLGGEWINEGSYFTEFQSKTPAMDEDGNPLTQRPWHVVTEMPTIHGKSILHSDNRPYIRIYRCLDWGFRPDPAVCIWVAVLPNGHTIAFKERSWRETLAKDVAKAIRLESEGMHIIDTFADPTIFAKRGETEFSVGQIIENERVPLTPSINDRTRFGLAICDYLGTVLTDGQGDYPKLQILDKDGRWGCPDLIRTIPDVQTDQRDSTRIADGGEDHWVVALAYFCMGDTPAPKDPDKPSRPRWMMSKREFRTSFGTTIQALE